MKVDELPAGTRPIGLTWAFRAKDTPDGDYLKTKARCALRGDEEKHDIDKYAAYSPVMNQVTMRLHIAHYLHDPLVRFWSNDKHSSLHT